MKCWLNQGFANMSKTSFTLHVNIFLISGEA